MLRSFTLLLDTCGFLYVVSCNHTSIRHGYGHIKPQTLDPCKLRVLADILLALDRGDFAALLMLDLSAAFDTVDHTTLLRRVRSYLSGRTQYARSGSTSSVPYFYCIYFYFAPKWRISSPKFCIYGRKFSDRAKFRGRAVAPCPPRHDVTGLLDARPAPE